MNFTMSDLVEGLKVLGLAGSALSFFGLLWLRSKFVPKESYELAEKIRTAELQDVRDRLVIVESVQRSAPDHDDLKELGSKVELVGNQVAEMRGVMEGVRDQLDILLKHHIGRIA